MDFNPIYIFDFEFKCTLMSFNILFLVIKIHIFNLIYIVFIDIRFNIFMCFLLRTYFIIFFQEDFTHCMVNNIIVLFLTVKSISIFWTVPTVLSTPNFI